MADERKARLNWVEKELTKHLRKKGVKIPPLMTVTQAVKMIIEE